MIYLLLSLFIILPVLAGLGSLFEKIFGKIWEGLSAQLLSGILFITLIWCILAFFIPIDMLVEFFTLLIGVFSFLYHKSYRIFFHFFKKNATLFPIVLLVIVFFAAFYPFILDHFGYYVPTIHWISEVGLVKGISNLDLILGQMSFWHIFQAGFSHFSDPFLRINVVALLVYLVYILEKKSWVQLCFLPILFLFLQSPSTDLPVIAFSLMLLNEIISRNQNTSLLFAFSVFIFTIKPTMIWLPILCLLYSVFMIKKNWSWIFFGGFILLLFFLKNIWTFGYPVFPVAIVDVGVSWKPNPALLKNSAEMALLKTYDLQYQYSEIQQFSWWDSIQNWIFLDGIKSNIHIAMIISLLAFIIYTLKVHKKILTFLCFSLVIKTALVLGFSAQYRFFLDVFFVIGFILLHKHLNQKKSVMVFIGVSFVLALVFSFPKIVQTTMPSFRLGNFMAGFEISQLWKPSVYSLNQYKKYEVGNLEFNVSKDYPFIFDTPIPSISPGFIQEDFQAHIFPQKIGKDWKEGFIWKKIDKNEEQKIKEILKELNYPTNE